jgi:release factor glutamine methyltransferase
MPSSAKQMFFNDHVFNVPENVYEPAEDSFLFAEYLVSESGKHVLDVGTGCGILGVVVAANAARIVAIDISPYAVRCARENAELNGVIGKFYFIQGDLLHFLNVDDKFDLILFNAPYVPTDYCEDVSWLERAWAGGKTGGEVIDRFICQCPDHLMPSGRILLLQSTLSNVETTLKSFNREGLRAQIVAMRDLPFFESIVLIEATRAQ